MFDNVDWFYTRNMSHSDSGTASVWDKRQAEIRSQHGNKKSLLAGEHDGCCNETDDDLYVPGFKFIIRYNSL